MLVRFLEYSFTDKYDDHADPNFVTGIEVTETYDRFIKTLEFMIEKERVAELKGETYLIDDYRISYSGDDESRMSLDVYMLKELDTTRKTVEV